MMFGNHKTATSIGALGAAAVLGHALLGPSIIPVAVALTGAVVAAAAGVFLAAVRRRSPVTPNDRPGENRSEHA